MQYFRSRTCFVFRDALLHVSDERIQESWAVNHRDFSNIEHIVDELVYQNLDDLRNSRGVFNGSSQMPTGEIRLCAEYHRHEVIRW